MGERSTKSVPLDLTTPSDLLIRTVRPCNAHWGNKHKSPNQPSVCPWNKSACIIPSENRMSVHANLKPSAMETGDKEQGKGIETARRTRNREGVWSGNRQTSPFLFIRSPSKVTSHFSNFNRECLPTFTIFLGNQEG